MDSENEHETAPPKPGLRERIGQRAWVRSAALVGSGLTVGAIVAGTVTANAADEGRDASTGQHDGRGHHGPRGAATRRSRSGATRSCSPAPRPSR